MDITCAHKSESTLSLSAIFTQCNKHYALCNTNKHFGSHHIGTCVDTLHPYLGQYRGTDTLISILPRRRIHSLIAGFYVASILSQTKPHRRSLAHSIWMSIKRFGRLVIAVRWLHTIVKFRGVGYVFNTQYHRILVHHTSNVSVWG